MWQELWVVRTWCTSEHVPQHAPRSMHLGPELRGTLSCRPDVVQHATALSAGRWYCEVLQPTPGGTVRSCNQPPVVSEGKEGRA